MQSVIDEELADLVWEAWDSGQIDDKIATQAWLSILLGPLT